MKFWGIIELSLVEKVVLFLEKENFIVVFYVNYGEVKLWIFVCVMFFELVNKLIIFVEEEIKDIVGIDFYGINDEFLVLVVGKLLLEFGEILVVVEFCIGGSLGSMLIFILGSLEYFYGGVISYEN